MPNTEPRRQPQAGGPALFDAGDPRQILAWAAEAYDNLAVVTSFQSSGLAILHMLLEIRPGLPVLFLDTGFHFEETLRFRDEVTQRWGLNLIVLRGDHGTPKRQAELYGPWLYRSDPDRCCHINKVVPLQRALEGYDAWISGLRRDQSPARAEVEVVGSQTLLSGREVAKIHPLAAWSQDRVDAYLEEHGIKTHPLLEQGYASIGCWPCTRPPAPGEAPRAGRWYDFDKKGCGIHTFGTEASPQDSSSWATGRRAKLIGVAGIVPTNAKRTATQSQYPTPLGASAW